MIMKCFFSERLASARSSKKEITGFDTYHTIAYQHIQTLSRRRRWQKKDRGGQSTGVLVFFMIFINTNTDNGNDAARVWGGGGFDERNGVFGRETKAVARPFGMENRNIKYWKTRQHDRWLPKKLVGVPLSKIFGRRKKIEKSTEFSSTKTWNGPGPEFQVARASL